MKEITIANIMVANDENLDLNRQLALQCMEGIFGEGSQGNVIMFPTALSVSGIEPAQYFLCSMDITFTVLDKIKQFAEINNMALVIEEATKDEFLSNHGLKEI